MCFPMYAEWGLIEHDFFQSQIIIIGQSKKTSFYLAVKRTFCIFAAE